MVVSEAALMGPRTCMPADFERQSALLVGVSELLPHHPHVLTGLVSALVERLPVIAVITGEEQRRDLLTTLCDWGLPAHRVRAVRSPATGLWLRDYGPSFVKRDGRVCLLDAEHPAAVEGEDWFAAELGRMLEAGVNGVPLRVGGGDILSNGRGVLITSSAVVIGNAGRHAASAAVAKLCAHYGFRQIACVPPVANLPAAKAEMFATFVSADTVVVGRCDASEDPVTARALDMLSDAVRGMDAGAGALRVERIPVPPRRGGVWRSYTGVVFANDAVIVPTYAGVDERVERDALDTYRRLLPEREILTVEATSLAKAGGTLRSATLNIPHLGHPMAFDDAVPPPFSRGDDLPRPSSLEAFVTSGGWFGPRRSVLRMDA